MLFISILSFSAPLDIKVAPIKNNVIFFALYPPEI